MRAGPLVREYDGSRPCLPPRAMMELARRIASKQVKAFLRTGRLVWKEGK